MEVARQPCHANVDDDPVLITEDSGEQFVFHNAYLAQGYVLYRIGVIGDPGLQGCVQETLEKVLSEFENV